MLNFLFRGLTADPARGAKLFSAVTAEARRSHWFIAGAVPDTLDGRFAMLSTIAALVLVRLEQLGEDGNDASVALTERFIEVMEAEHRELGLGDPTLGKKVRKLVGSLARRTQLWREAVGGERRWDEAAGDSVYGAVAEPAAARHTADGLKLLWKKLKAKDVTALLEGRLE